MSSGPSQEFRKALRRVFSLRAKQEREWRKVQGELREATQRLIRAKAATRKGLRESFPRLRWMARFWRMVKSRSEENLYTETQDKATVTYLSMVPGVVPTIGQFLRALYQALYKYRGRVVRIIAYTRGQKRITFSKDFNQAFGDTLGQWIAIVETGDFDITAARYIDSENGLGYHHGVSGMVESDATPQRVGFFTLVFSLQLAEKGSPLVLIDPFKSAWEDRSSIEGSFSKVERYRPPEVKGKVDIAAIRRELIGVLQQQLAGDDSEELRAYQRTLSNRITQYELSEKAKALPGPMGGMTKRVLKTNKFVLEDYYGDIHNDCVLKAIGGALGKRIWDKHCAEIKARIGMSRDAPVYTTTQLLNLSVYFNINIVLYDDVADGPVYTTPKRDGPTVFLLRKEDHAFVIKEFIHKEEAPTVFLYFDFETVFMPSGKLIPYAVSTQVREEGKEACKPKVDICENPTQGTTAAHLFMTRLRECCYMYPKSQICLVGFNSSRFDLYLILRKLLSAEYRPQSFFFSGNSLLKMTVGNRITCWDLCRYLPMRLADVAGAFGLKVGKGDLDHDRFQAAYMTGKLECHIKANREQLLDYCARDVVVLKDAHIAFEAALKQLFTFDKPLIHYPTMSGFGWAQLRKTISTPLWSFKSLQAELEHKHVRFAGRSEVLRFGQYEEQPTFCMDFCSQYPDAMFNFPFPIGPPVYVEKEVPQTGPLPPIAIYNCTILSHGSFVVVPCETQGGLDWNSPTPFTRPLYSPTIAAHRACGGEIVIHDGIYFPETSAEVFKKYLAPIFAEKQKQDDLKEKTGTCNRALREACKLAMNSQSGKLIQRRFLCAKQICTNTREIEQFKEKHNNPECVKKYKNGMEFWAGTKKGEKSSGYPHVAGALVYEWARYKFVMEVLRHVSRRNVIYIETDCCLLTWDGLHEVLEKNPRVVCRAPHGMTRTSQKKELGLIEDELPEKVVPFLKEQGYSGAYTYSDKVLMVDGAPCEWQGPYIICVQKKAHAYYMKNTRTGELKEIKAVFKGINRKGCRVINEVDKRVKFTNDKWKFKEVMMSEENTHNLCLKDFFELWEKKELYITTSPLVKLPSELCIKQEAMVKRVVLLDDDTRYLRGIPRNTTIDMHALMV